jgi:hypothetical protein
MPGIDVCIQNSFPAETCRLRHHGVHFDRTETNSLFTAEHLAAIALQTGCGKDKARLLQFIESGAIDGVAFQAIVARHGLTPAWEKFKAQFLGDDI